MFTRPSTFRHGLALMGICAVLLDVPGGAAVGAEKKAGDGIEWDNGRGRPAAGTTDARYTPEALREAFRALCRDIGYRIERVEVDQAEFPFIVYGVLAGRCSHHDIRNGLQGRRGYAYVGSTTRFASDGSKTYFALNMIPHDQQPKQNDRMRVINRLKALMDCVSGR